MKTVLRLFEFTLILFALSVALTMYWIAAGEGEHELMGINYSYYILPLLAVNIMTCLINANSLKIKGFGKWILLWTLISSASALVIGNNNLNTLIRVNIWTTTFFASYCLAKNSRYAIESIVKVFVVIFFISLLFFWQGKVYQSISFNNGFGTRSNAIYCLITIIPLIMLLKRKWFVLVLILLAFVSTVFSSKRGATLILILSLIPVTRSVFSGMKSKTWRGVFVIMLVGAIAYMTFFISESYLGGVLMDRFAEAEESGGSGRTDLWKFVISAFDNSSFGEQLLGHGYRAVSYLGENTAAHNDFIEVLYDYGIIGMVIYLSIHIYLIIKTIRLRRQRNNLFFPFVVMYIIFFVMSMFSILIVQQRYLVYMAVFWGMLEGCNYKYTAVSENRK